MNDHTIYIALDTMIYLHYRSIDQMDLAKFFTASQVTLIVPRITVQELDTHKNTHPNAKIRERARKRLLALMQWINTGVIRPDLNIIFVAPRPDIDFKANGLDAQWNDDQLLATIIHFKEHNARNRVVLITQDTGLLLSAKHLGIEAVSVADEDRLPAETDTMAKENQELKNEILRLKSAQPALALRLKGMADNEQHATFELLKPSKETSIDKDNFLAEIKRDLPEKHPPSAPINDTGMPTRAFIDAFTEVIPADEYDRYNREREVYFKKVAQYLERLAAYHTQPDRTLLLEIEMRNTGTIPAEDIDLSIHFPDGFELYSEDDLPDEPQLPKPPDPPLTDMQKRFSRLSANMNSVGYLPHFRDVLSPSSFSLTKTNSYDLEDHVLKLKHGCKYEIRRLYLVFSSYTDAHSFQISYRLSAANLPTPACGELFIIVDKK